MNVCGEIPRWVRLAMVRSSRISAKLVCSLLAEISVQNLKPQEVKALRAGKGQISDAFGRVENDEVYLHNAHIDEYSHGNLQNHQPKAPRKLLLHRSEIRKLCGLAAVKGNALVPLAFYWKNGKVKVALGVGKGKAEYDKRDDLRERESDRELKRATMRRSKGS